MSPSNPRYNERAWAIDVISEINRYSATRSRAIVRAGGEYSLSGQSGNLFPDVLLFGDNNGTIVQQGWELKMPETPITDSLLLINAEQKARRLGLNSFLVWNALQAALYIKNDLDVFQQARLWPITTISRREDVELSRNIWVNYVHNIIDELNDLFDARTVIGALPDATINDALFIDYISHYTPHLKRTIEQSCRTNALFAAELNIWWIDNEYEHPGLDKFEGLARVNIINWINRFLFAHYLKIFHRIAGSVDTIQIGTSVQDAITIFENISSSCDFFNVFSPALGQQYLDSHTWSGLIDLNIFLIQIRLDSLNPQNLHNVLDNALLHSRKKLAGQFSTPKSLAKLLARVTVNNPELAVIDPCCGTGTIARAAYELKQSHGISVRSSFQNIWASDKFAFPLQLCSIALLDPSGIGEVVQVFKRDAFELNPNQAISFTDPNDGNQINRALPYFHAIISNLPFVRFENNQTVNPLINNIKARVQSELGRSVSLDNRTDLYAYFLLHFYQLLGEQGYVGVITSNSWLATKWGKKFKDVLSRYFKIKKVIISGKGRWFSNADVVTTILILEKRRAIEQPQPEEQIEFITTTQLIDNWEQMPGGVINLADNILITRTVTPNNNFTWQRYSRQQIQSIEAHGIGWPALFVNLNWVNSILTNLVPVRNYFEINRGERRGWDPLFYPSTGHGIEPEFIQRVLLSPRGLDDYIIDADEEAFCCSCDMADLIARNKTGAIAWIRRFQTATNGTGQPLPAVLERSNCQWYEMRPNTMADLVLAMNPDQKLCVHRLRTRSFVNQRLIRFTKRENVDISIVDLLHALMNSVIGMFQIEAGGFGRGLGVLDLNATKLSENMHMLNPDVLTTQQKSDILNAFRPLLARPVSYLNEELQLQDRIHFDNVVLNAFGVGTLQNQIYDSLRALFHIRKTALE